MKACIPTKCIAQMPIPIAVAPPVNQAKAYPAACGGNASCKIKGGVRRSDRDQYRQSDRQVIV